MSAFTEPTDNEPSGQQDSSPRSAAHCPSCGARVQAQAARCWYCEGELRLVDPRSLPGRIQAAMTAVPPLPQPGEPLQFSLTTLLVVLTFVAACLGISVAVPPLGIPLSVIAAGGLVRTLAVGHYYRRLGMPYLLDDRIGEFTVSCGIMIGAVGVLLVSLLAAGIIGLSAAAAIGQLGLPRELEIVLLWTYCAAGVLAPLAASGWFLWATRPR
jgi:hypothetical protein